MVKLNRRCRFFLLLACLSWTKAALSQDSIKVYADPESMTGFKAAKFIEKIDFLPLETNKQSKYRTGAGYQIAGSDILIKDNTNNSIYLFDKKSGKFLHKYTNEKSRFVMSHIEYVPSKNALFIKSINKHYTITDKKNTQLVRRWQGRDISRYVRLTWLYLDKNYQVEQIPAPAIALNNEFYYFDGGYIYRNYSNDNHTKDSILYRLVQYDGNNQIKHRYFPFLNLHGLWSDYYRYSLRLSENSTLDDSSQLFQLDFNPIIYELRPDTLIEKYHFVFPMANVMPVDFNSLSFRNNIDVQKYKDKNAKVFSDYFKMFEHGQYLIFATRTLSYQTRQFMLAGNILYDLDKITTDSSIFNLPPNLLTQVFGQDQQYLYTVASAPTLLKHKAALLKDKNLSSAFKAYLSVMTEQDNDIIIKIKLK